MMMMFGFSSSIIEMAPTTRYDINLFENYASRWTANNIRDIYKSCRETFLFVSVHKWTLLHAALIQKNKTNEVAEKLHLI